MKLEQIQKHAVKEVKIISLRTVFDIDTLNKYYNDVKETVLRSIVPSISVRASF